MQMPEQPPATEGAHLTAPNRALRDRKPARGVEEAVKGVDEDFFDGGPNRRRVPIRRAVETRLLEADALALLPSWGSEVDEVVVFSGQAGARQAGAGSALVAGMLGAQRGWRIELGAGDPCRLTVLDDTTSEAALEAEVAIAGTGLAARAVVPANALPRTGRLAEALRAGLPAGALLLPLPVHHLVAVLALGADLRPADGRLWEVHHLNFNGVDNRAKNLVAMPEEDYLRLHALWPPRDKAAVAAGLALLARFVPAEQLRPAERALETALSRQRTASTPRRKRVPPVPKPGAYPPPTPEQIAPLIRPELRHHQPLVLAAAQVLAAFGPAGATATEFAVKLAGAEGWSKRKAQAQIPVAVSSAGGLIRHATKTELREKFARYWLDPTLVGGAAAAAEGGASE